MSEWTPTTLGEVVRLQRGHDLTASEQLPGNIPVMGSAGPNGTHNRALADGPGVVVGRSGASMGKVHYVQSGFWPHNTCLYVTDFMGNNPRFVYHLLKGLDLASYNSGSAQPSLNRNFIYSLPVMLPSRRHQDEIAELVGSIDDRIALLRETNATLEAIAQALFKSWFVDFDPVRAKSEALAPEGMDEATAALFPDTFEDSPRGRIPTGWTVQTVGDHTSIKGGKMLDRSRYGDTGLNPVFGGAGLMGMTDEANAHGTVITVGRVGAYCGQFFWHRGSAWVNNNASLISAHTVSTSTWLFLSLKSADVETIKKGAAQPFVSNGDIAALPLVTSPPGIILAFCRISEVLFAAMAQTDAQRSLLTQIKNELLPRLISGQLRIGAEKQAPDELAASAGAD